MKKRPFISVVIPCYNSEKYIGTAIQSILDQTHLPDEIIVCDDASTDNSWQVITDLARRHPVILAKKNKENLGTVRTRNGLNSLVSSESDYIAILDSDDIALPKRIESQTDFLESNPDYVGCGTNMNIIDSQGVIIGHKEHRLPNDVKKYVVTWNPFVQSSMVLRANTFDLVGSYDESLTRGEDHDMWLRILSQNYLLAILPEFLTQFRVHEEQGKTVKSAESYRQYALVRRRYIFNKKFFSIKGFVVTMIYSVLAFVPGSIMVWLYKNVYAK